MSSDLAMPITKHKGLNLVRKKRERKKKRIACVYLAPVAKANSLLESHHMNGLLMIVNETRYTSIHYTG